MPRIGGLNGLCLLGIAACLIGWHLPEALGDQTVSMTATSRTMTDGVVRLAQVPPTPPPPTVTDTPPDDNRPAADEPPPVVSPPPRPLTPAPLDQGLFALLLGRGAQPGRSPRLASVPNMFGDSFGLGGSVVFSDVGGDLSLPDPAGAAPLPLAGASRRVKVTENNKALPMDRVYFTYNHFHHVLEFSSFDVSGSPVRRVLPVDRYTLAAEKTFLDGLSSIEIRMPLSSRADFDTGLFGVSGGEVGNLAVLLKLLMIRTETTAAVIGLTIDSPTGSDVTGYAPGFEYVLRNEAVHLGPYAGFLCEPNERVFYQGFLQIDVPANSNTVDIENAGDPPFSLSGRLHDQTLLYLDVGAGYWLRNDPRAQLLTGLAALVEFHYVTTLSDADLLTVTDGVTALTFGNAANRVDQVNFTIGLHAELRRNTIFRVGGVFPLSDQANRSFESELQVQVERRF